MTDIVRKEEREKYVIRRRDIIEQFRDLQIITVNVEITCPEDCFNVFPFKQVLELGTKGFVITFLIEPWEKYWINGKMHIAISFLIHEIPYEVRTRPKNLMESEAP